ncbi:MAG: hypothetical protein ABL894_12170, partial [Hyphomicrobium sp.]
VSGRAIDIQGRAKVEGELTASINVTALASAAVAPENIPKSEVTAKIAGDATGVEFKDIAVTLAQAATPQLVSGSAKVSWPERTKIELSLASRWLDFDKLLGDGKVVPIDVVRNLFDTLASNLPEQADTSTQVIVDQVTLGGEAVSDVRFHASRAGGALELNGVRANLPGGARVEFDGEVLGADAGRVFKGAVALSGQSLQHFVTWGMGKDGPINARADGPFAFEGALTLSRSEIAVREATAEIAGMPLSGEFSIGLQGRRTVSIAVEGDRLDASAIWPGVLQPSFAAGLLQSPLLAPAAASTLGGAQSPLPPATPAGVEATPSKDYATENGMDVRVRLQAVELADGDTVLKNVDANFAIVSGVLAMPKLNFTTADGLSVELEGETKVVQVAATAESAAMQTGQVRGVVTAADSVAISSLTQALGLAPGKQPMPQAFASLAPLRLAGNMNLGARTAQSADIQIDGVAGGSRVTAALLLDGGWGAWRTNPGDITVTMESANIARALAALMGRDAKNAALDFDPPRAGRVVIKAVADAASAYLSNATLKSEGVEIRYDGVAMFAPEGGWLSNGDVRVNTDDARAALALAGLRTGKGLGQVALAGTVKLTAGNGTQTYVLDGLQAGASRVSGRVAVSGPAASHDTVQPESIDADLSVDTASVPALFALLTGETQAALPSAEALQTEEKSGSLGKKRRLQSQQVQAPTPIAASEPSVWPSQTFDTRLFANLDGKIKVSFGALSIEPGFGLSDAVLEATVTPGQINIAHMDGKALGGVITSALTIGKDPAGIKLAASFALNAGGSASSSATMKFDASGRGASPAGLIGDLKGKGELALPENALHVNSPAALTPVAEAALQGTGPAAGEELLSAVRAALKDGSQSLGGFSIPLTVGDGVVRFEKVRLDTAEGRSQFDAVIELDSLKLVSEWQIEPKVQRVSSSAANAERIVLAPVSIVYNGKLKDIASLEPDIAIAALERELSVRKMERDVEELERLRKADQARAAAEQERRNAAEAERAKAASAAKAARDAASAANAAQMPGLVPQTSGDNAAPAVPTKPPQPQGLNGGESSVPVEPSTVSAQDDGGNGDGASAAVAASGDAIQAGAAEGASGSGRAQPSWRPTVRKKRAPEAPTWKPFQVTPY